MVELKYKDTYGIERTSTYENWNEFMISLTGCLTLPDYLPIISVVHDGEDLGYHGDFGQLYFEMSKLDRK